MEKKKKEKKIGKSISHKYNKSDWGQWIVVLDSLQMHW